jgi:hypothetical protein
MIDGIAVVFEIHIRLPRRRAIVRNTEETVPVLKIAHVVSEAAVLPSTGKAPGADLIIIPGEEHVPS